MNILSLISSVFDPVVRLVDELHTSEEEKAEAKLKLMVMHAKMYANAQKHEEVLIKAQTSIIKAEAQGQSWLQRSWRPITMLTFLALVVCDSFGFLTFRLSEEAWTLLQIGLGGYVAGRSAEKIAPSIKDMMGRPRVND